jgi:hypothetical protein
VFGLKPDKLTVKDPVLAPLWMFVPDPIAGEVLLALITTPLAVTAEPPSAVTLPPVDAVVWVIEVAELVIVLGHVTVCVLNCMVLP